MLDINFIKENRDLVENAIINKNLSDSVNLEELLNLYETYLNTLRLVETKRSLRNKITQDIPKFLDPQHAYERQKLMQEATEIKKDLQELDTKLTESEESYKKLLLLIPNVYAEDVPVGKSEDENVVARQVGTPKEFNFKVRDHIELGQLLDIIDLETAGIVSGSRFYYLKNEAVMLEFAIINFVMNTIQDKELMAKLAKSVNNPSEKTFSPILPPVFVRPEVMKRMDRLDPLDERYYFEKDNLVLVGSAEHTLGPMHMDKVFKEAELPLRYIGFSTSFRRESGSYGKDVKGIIRTHQFDKLEMESFSTVENGRVEQDLFVAIQEYLLQQLEIPYQVISICTGDMGKPDFRQIDMECHIPSQGKYRETHTSDYMTDFQARRLNTAYVDKDNNRHFVHMNDATAFAIGRILVALLENNQQEDGSVLVPKVLTKYTNFDKILPKL